MINSLFNFFFSEDALNSYAILFVVSEFLSNKANKKKFLASLRSRGLLLLRVALFSILSVGLVVDSLTLGISFYDQVTFSYTYIRDNSNYVLKSLNETSLNFWAEDFKKSYAFLISNLKTSGFSLGLLIKSLLALDESTKQALIYFVATFVWSCLLFSFLKDSSKTVSNFNQIHKTEGTEVSALFSFMLCIILNSFFLSAFWDRTVTEGLAIAFFLWAPSSIHFGKYAQILTIWVYIDYYWQTNLLKIWFFEFHDFFFNLWVSHLQMLPPGIDPLTHSLFLLLFLFWFVRIKK